MRLFLLLLALALTGMPADEPWTDAQVIQPAALAARLSDPHAAKPKILYVGPGILYRQKHIPGAEFAGPVNTAAGMELFKQALAKLPRDGELILYCGCCPLEHCPNLRPAFSLVSSLGYRRAKVLMTPTSFLKDWIEKGYPVEPGSAR